jgi:PAS domain S-box-containing protein
MPTTEHSGTGSTSQPARDWALDEVTFHALVDAAPDGIVMADDEGQILFANRQAELLFGFGRDELVGRSVDGLLPERLQHVHAAHRSRYRAEPRLRAMGAGLVLFGRRTDGTEFPVEISLSPLRAEAGARVVAVIRDVTARVAAEAEQRMVREALDATRDGVLILEADTLRFTYANEGAVAQVGYSRDELVEMTMLDVAPEFTEHTLRDLLEPMTRGEQSSIMFTTVHRHRDGSDVPVEILMQAIPGDDGVPTRYVKIVRDVRERMQTEERLRRAEQHLRIVEDRERIARDLHDVVIQKLFAAGMTVQRVAARSAEPEHGARLDTVVDELDDTIREIRSVIFGLQSDLRDSSGVRADVLRICDDHRDALGFEPRIRFEGPVDAMSERVAAELLPAVREAISNVSRHAEASAVELTIEHAGDFVTLRVVDDGCGLPATVSWGNGIHNLSERATRLGGRCLVSARPEGGTALEWQVPNRA